MTTEELRTTERMAEQSRIASDAVREEQPSWCPNCSCLNCEGAQKQAEAARLDGSLERRQWLLTELDEAIGAELRAWSIWQEATTSPFRFDSWVKASRARQRAQQRWLVWEKAFGVRDE